ncbi:MAG: hypothetical protein JXR31_14045 [Prolixibacteraceae bacterium]|nr:hypothetical protein [Prolixibacteraceae bacterium]MBN2775373.1 hypothetical protein [Prolixibacteraceae bacterium]
MKSFKFRQVETGSFIKKNFFINNVNSVTNEPEVENSDYIEYLENYRNTTRWQTV